MGIISIENIEISGNHGVYYNEKQLTQKFLVSISFEYEFYAAAKDDDLEKTVNYSSVVDLCKTVFKEPRSLLETLAMDIGTAIKSEFPGTSAIKVTVGKPEVQLGVKLQGVFVTNTID